jgi:type VI protein secretion system component VasK
MLLNIGLGQVVVLAASLLIGVHAHAGMSNEDFAKQVKAQMELMAKDDKAAAQAKELCTNLPANRVMEEPRCVAYQKHVSLTSTKSKSGVPQF